MGNIIGALVRRFVEAFLLRTWWEIKMMHNEAAAAGIVRRCRASSRLGLGEQLGIGVVEYELVRPDARANITEGQAEKMLARIRATGYGGKRNVVWLSGNTCACRGTSGRTGEAPLRLVCWYCCSNIEGIPLIYLYGGDPVGRRRSASHPGQGPEHSAVRILHSRRQ